MVINRVRVLGSGPHTPTQFFWEWGGKTQGQLICGGGKTSKRVRRKFGRRKVKSAKKSSLGQSGDGDRKTLFFSAQSQSGKARSRFVFPYINDTWPYVGRGFTQGEICQSAQSIREIVRHICKKLAENTLDLSQVS